jgi:hypothetical protein
MVFERADSSFGCIASMDMGGDKLILKFVLFETLLEVGRSLIVKNVQFRLIATLCKMFMTAGPTTFDLGSCFVLEGDHQDAVTVVIVNYD